MTSNSAGAAQEISAYYDWGSYSGGDGSSEIEEVRETNCRAVRKPLESISESSDFVGGGDEAVYVAVGKQSEEMSMDALVWTLNNLTSSSTVVCLIHIFPETKHIPTPLGKLPISQVNCEQKENYMAQERGKRREFLQKFLDICAASQVPVDTILIESDGEAKAILDLIPILNITKLVMGTTKSNIRRTRAKRGNGLTDQILQNAPAYCEVKVICEGKEMSEMPLNSPSSSPSPRAAMYGNSNFSEDRQPACGCFNIK